MIELSACIVHSIAACDAQVVSGVPTVSAEALFDTQREAFLLQRSTMFFLRGALFVVSLSSCATIHRPTTAARLQHGACATGPECAAAATALLVDWMLGYELGPNGERTGAAYRNATVPAGIALAARAVALDPGGADAAVAQSTALLLQWRWTDAATEARRAVALNSSNPGAWAWLAKVQTALVDLNGA